MARVRAAVERYHGIGVRIEDDYVVTPHGVERITSAPREIDDEPIRRRSNSHERCDFTSLAPTVAHVAILVRRPYAERIADAGARVQFGSSFSERLVQPSQLDLQLAWAFRDFPIVWDRLAGRGVQLADVERAWTRHRRKRNAGQALLTLEEHAEFYGVTPRAEAERDVVRLRWPLRLWPEYELAGFFAPDTGVVEEGMRFREPPVVQRASEPLTIDQATALLRLGEHTEIELLEVLGPGDPDDGNGWSPESYFYYDLADGRSLQCLTVHGLLVELSPVEARRAVVDQVAPAPVRRRRWWEFWKPAA